MFSFFTCAHQKVENRVLIQKKIKRHKIRACVYINYAFSLVISRMDPQNGLEITCTASLNFCHLGINRDNQYKKRVSNVKCPLEI